MRNFFVHLHPPQVTARALRPMTTLGLGVALLTLFGVLGVTGLLLMIYYVPAAGEALESTRDLQYAVTFGGFVRSLHRYAGHAMVLFAFCHLLRVLLTGAYRGRALNWLVGLVLFVLTLGLAFTGYLLPADQLAYWAVVVSTNLLDHAPGIGGALKGALLGGGAVGQAALVRFYALHVAILPGLMAALVVWHLWRLRKDGGLARDPASNPETVPAHPHLTLREAALALFLLAGLVLFASMVAAPLGGAPDIHQPSNPEKTPWYFLFLQEMVSYSAITGGFVFPLILLAGLAAVPFADPRPDRVGVWFGGGAERRTVVASFVAAVTLFVLMEVLFLRGQGAAGVPGGARSLLNPAAGMLLLAIGAVVVAGIAARTPRAALLSAGVVLTVAVVGFSLVAWCRGPGWVFYWPWEAWPHV